MGTITDEILIEGLKQRAQMIEDELNLVNDPSIRNVLLRKSEAIFNVARMFGAKNEEWTIRHSFIYKNMKESLKKLK